MSSETRTIRPFVGGADFQRALGRCALQRLDGSGAEGGDVRVDLDEFLNAPIILRFPGDTMELVHSGLASCDLRPRDVDLVVLVSSPRLRFVDVAYRAPLSELGESLTSLQVGEEERPRAFRAPHGGADIRVYFCLNKQLPQRPLMPWRKGTWLGMQEFRVRTELSGTGFVPIRLTDEDRQRLGLPPDTVRFVTLEDADPFDSSPSGDAVKLYIDGDLLDRLAVMSSTPFGKHLQRQLFLDAVTAVVFAAHAEARERPELVSQHVDDFAGSLVHRLVGMVAGRGARSGEADARQSAYRRMLEDPNLFLARVEARMGLRRTLLESFGGAT